MLLLSTYVNLFMLLNNSCCQLKKNNVQLISIVLTVDADIVNCK